MLCSPPGRRTQDPEKSKDPVDFVQALLDERDKYEAVVVQSFHEDKAFRNALNQVRAACACARARPRAGRARGTQCAS